MLLFSWKVDGLINKQMSKTLEKESVFLKMQSDEVVVGDAVGRNETIWRHKLLQGFTFKHLFRHRKIRNFFLTFFRLRSKQASC